MAYTAKRLLEIAAAELDYCEKDSDENLDFKSAKNDGDGNHTKYARDLRKAGYYNGDKCGYAWCDVFVDWCFYQLADKDPLKAQEMECQTGELGAGCIYSAGYYRTAGRFSSAPRVGDQIFFGVIGDEDHTGLVEWFNSTHVGTIEGNTDNRVARRTYGRDDVQIVGYGHPKFDAEEITVTPPSAFQFKVGDVVRFIGVRHYVNAVAETGVVVAPGRAKVTLVAEGSKHPYHIRAIDAEGQYTEGVFGWVNACDLVDGRDDNAVYVVRYGDTLEEIGAKYGFTATLLAKRNGIANPNLIYPGQKLVIPTDKKPIEEIAKEVIRGEWGNGKERSDLLTKAGYNAAAVQERVNQLL